MTLMRNPSKFLVAQRIAQPRIVCGTRGDARSHPPLTAIRHVKSAAQWSFTARRWFVDDASTKWFFIGYVQRFRILYPLDGFIHRDDVNVRQGLGVLDKSKLCERIRS